MKRVLLLATTTGYQIRSFGSAGENLGVNVTIVSDRCDRLDDPWWDGAIPVRFHDLAGSTDAVVGACGGARPDGVVAVGDRPVVLAAHLCRAFGLPGHAPEAAAVTRNKLLARRALRAAGMSTPWFVSVPIDDPVDGLARTLSYPAVVKPLALSGSRGVMRVDTPAECIAAVERLRRLLQNPDIRIEHDEAHREILVESFIPGREYAVEGLLDGGRLRTLAVFDKPDPLDGPFFEETLYVTPPSIASETEDRVVAAVANAARAIGLHHGPIHAECRVNGSAVFVLEVAARPIGGLCSRALRFVTRGSRGGEGGHVTLEELLLRHVTGEDVSEYTREDAASGVMMIPVPRRGIYRCANGVSEAREVPGVEEVRITAKTDALLVPLPEGRSYLGFIFARAPEPRQVERALREAHGRLRFTIDREVRVERR